MRRAGRIGGEKPVVEPVGEHRFTVAALDYGIKAMTPHRLANPSDVDSVSIWMVVGRGGTPVL